MQRRGYVEQPSASSAAPPASVSPAPSARKDETNGYRSGVSIGGVDLGELKLDSTNRKKNAAILAAGYTPAKRRFEVAVMTVFVTMVAFFALQALRYSSRQDVWIVVAMFVVAQVVTDLISGWVHWGCDTWGQLDTPVVGPTFIRSFREHHVDPTAMCTHDFVQTNADTCIPAIFVMSCVLGFHTTAPATRVDLAVFYFCVFGSIFAAFTNEFHKWSHLHNAPAWITALQSLWIVLPKKHHAVHHKPPFDKYYCITTGHLNWFLDSIGYWRAMETVVTSLTGYKPREDDKLWTGQIYGATSSPAEKSH